jgi:hypothetical protein
VSTLNTSSRPHIERNQPDNRRHHRVRVALLGRYMLPNRMEFPCRTLDISPGGAALIAPVKGSVGDRVVIYFEQIGRVEGEIIRHLPDGFAIQFHATIRARDKIGDQLTWLANRHELGLPEDRRHVRIVPHNQRTIMTLEDGREYVVRILDLSQSGAGLSTDMRPDLGIRVTIGKTEAKVVRHFVL